MNKFATEFKTFVNRGNVVDMSVGIIVGSAFTAIVTAISNSVLMPLINWILSLLFRTDAVSELRTFLKTVYVVDETGLVTSEIDLTQSIYISWGTLLHAVLNFFLIAIVLFTIVKLMNRLREEHRELTQRLAEITLDKDDRKALKAAGIKRRDKEAVAAYLKEKKRLAEEKQRADEAAAEEERRRAREENPTAEDLLKHILAELKQKNP